jgi:hypothetical protein
MISFQATSSPDVVRAIEAWQRTSNSSSRVRSFLSVMDISLRSGVGAYASAPSARHPRAALSSAQTPHSRPGCRRRHVWQGLLQRGSKWYRRGPPGCACRHARGPWHAGACRCHWPAMRSIQPCCCHATVPTIGRSLAPSPTAVAGRPLSVSCCCCCCCGCCCIGRR